MQGRLPVTAPLVLNPLMARMAEAAGFPAGYLGGASGYLKVALEANLNLTEMCQASLDIRAVSSLPLILDGACGYGDPMHMHWTIGLSEAAPRVSGPGAVASRPTVTAAHVGRLDTRVERQETPRSACRVSEARGIY